MVRVDALTVIEHNDSTVDYTDDGDGLLYELTGGDGVRNVRVQDSYGVTLAHHCDIQSVRATKAKTPATLR